MIGIVGAGQIVAAAHLPAYASMGLPVRAVHDIDYERARALAARWTIRCETTLDDLLRHPEVEIVDIAVPPASQISIVEAALAAGKHVLAQKPLAPTFAGAKRLVEFAGQHGRKLVVNQQMRWSPVVRAIRSAVEDSRAGPIRWLTFDLDLAMPPSRFAGWISQEPRFTVLFNTIHLLDTARYLLGEPSSVSAVMSRGDPHLNMAGETDVMLALDFPEGARVWIVDRRNAFDDHRASFRVIGTQGALRGHFGLWTNYPTGIDDQIEYAPAGVAAQWQPLPVTGRWIPDAFTGPIGELIAAIDGGTQPSVSGADHLRTLKLVEAVYDSAIMGKRVDYGEYDPLAKDRKLTVEAR